MDFPEPDAPNGGYKAITALKCLRDASKVIEKHLMAGTQPGVDELSDFVNAIIIANGVECS
jgi:hypothetical protein